MQNTFQEFFQWLAVFDADILDNEAAVETKFVQPFFRLLGYADEYRREKFSIKASRRGKPGRKDEPDLIYFGTSDHADHNEATSLVIVEVKAPRINDLDDAIDQARRYAEYLKTPFLVVTNGCQLIVLKRHRHTQDETVFTGTVMSLKGISYARQLYDLLHFDIVTQIKAQLGNTLLHERYVLVERILRQHPDVQDILVQEAFTPSITHDDNHIKVTRSTIALDCILPVAFQEGRCTIAFSNILRRGLLVELTHQQILGTLMLGMHTPPEWNARLFLHQLDDGSYEVALGTIRTSLSVEEALDLCACVDVMCEVYQSAIVEVEDALETWDYPRMEIDGVHGFYVLSLSTSLWTCMKTFANAFDYSSGNSKWHIFEAHPTAIRVCDNKARIDSVLLWPKVSQKFLPGSMVDVVIQIPDWYLYPQHKKLYGSWQHPIGSQGVWTAHFTKNWLLKIFIPKVRRYYWWKYPFLSPTIQERHIDDMLYPVASLNNVHSAAALIPFLYNLHDWVSRYPTKRIAATRLQPLYLTLIEIVRTVDASVINIHYVLSKLYQITTILSLDVESAGDQTLLDGLSQDHKQVLNYLAWNEARITKEAYEHSVVADLLMRALVAVLQEERIALSQAQLNALIKVGLPLWKQWRFEVRHVYRYMKMLECDPASR